MARESIKLNENDIEYIVTEATKKIVEADRHRPGYYADYAEKQVGRIDTRQTIIKNTERQKNKKHYHKMILVLKNS